MSPRRYAPMKPSAGTTIPAPLRRAVLDRDGGRCVGPLVGMPGECWGAIELDHVRASHGIGMKSPTTLGNLVSLCSVHHRERTENGREWRPKLLLYLEVTADPHAHCVDPCGLDCRAGVPPQ